jgi:hypothetical protein
MHNISSHTKLHDFSSEFCLLPLLLQKGTIPYKKPKINDDNLQFLAKSILLFVGGIYILWWNTLKTGRIDLNESTLIKYRVFLMRLC